MNTKQKEQITKILKKIGVSFDGFPMSKQTIDTLTIIDYLAVRKVASKLDEKQITKLDKLPENASGDDILDAIGDQNSSLYLEGFIEASEDYFERLDDDLKEAEDNLPQELKDKIGL